jgi:integrase
LKEWVAYLNGTSKSDETIKQYVNNFKIWAVWNMENANDKFFTDMTKRDIINFQGYCLNDLKHSPARVRSLRSMLSSLSNYVEAILDDEYPKFRNIINKIEAPVLEKVREKLVMETSEVEKLLQDLIDKKKYQQACYFALAVYSGARKSELLRFKVDFFQDEYIKNGLYCTPEKVKTKGRSKLGKQLTKYTIAKFFRPFLDLWLEERKRLGIESEWLFVTKDKDGKYIQAKVSTANSWARMISGVLEEDMYFHSCRHNLCTYLVAANIPAEIIRELFGWSSQDLIRVYSDREASEDFNKYFSDDGVIAQDKKDTSSI